MKITDRANHTIEVNIFGVFHLTFVSWKRAIIQINFIEENW